MSLVLILSALTLSAHPVATQHETIDRVPAVEVNVPANPNEVIVCKNTMQPRSRFRKKSCRTRAEWDAITENSRAVVKELVDRPSIVIN